MGFIINPYLFAAATDADADAFISTAGITDSTQQSAIQTLVTDLKGYGIWTKMKAIYPFVGGTSTTHSYNLKDTSQYQITWYGGLTHNSNGVTGNGTNGYGDTFLNNNVMGQNSCHFSIYSRTDVNNQYVDIGVYSGGFGSAIYSRGSGTFQTTVNDQSLVSTSVADSLGLFLSSRTSSTAITMQKNSTQTSKSTNSSAPKTTSFKIFRPGDYAGEYSARNLAFSSIGDGLTDTEAANFYTAVQAFQTTLSRNV